MTNVGLGWKIKLQGSVCEREIWLEVMGSEAMKFLVVSLTRIEAR